MVFAKLNGSISSIASDSQRKVPFQAFANQSVSLYPGGFVRIATALGSLLLLIPGLAGAQQPQTPAIRPAGPKVLEARIKSLRPAQLAWRELTGPASQSEQKPDTLADAEQFPDEARKQLVEALGGPFLVYRDKVQEELKLTDEQRQRLLEKFPEYVQATMKVFEKIQEMKPEEREKTMQEHRHKSDEKLSALLQEVLEARQQERLFQLQLRQAGVFALIGENMAFVSMKITVEQRKKFMEVIQEMHKKIAGLAKAAQTEGKPEEIMPKVKKVRKEHEAKIEAILTDDQKKQWKELLGRPFELSD
jgi:hypothetical protein